MGVPTTNQFSLTVRFQTRLSWTIRTCGWSIRWAWSFARIPGCRRQRRQLFGPIARNQSPWDVETPVIWCLLVVAVAFATAILLGKTLWAKIAAARAGAGAPPPWFATMIRTRLSKQ